MQAQQVLNFVCKSSLVQRPCLGAEHAEQSCPNTTTLSRSTIHVKYLQVWWAKTFVSCTCYMQHMWVMSTWLLYKTQNCSRNKTTASKSNLGYLSLKSMSNVKHGPFSTWNWELPLNVLGFTIANVRRSMDTRSQTSARVVCHLRGICLVDVNRVTGVELNIHEHEIKTHTHMHTNVGGCWL